jgi:hypothetical protein
MNEDHIIIVLLKNTHVLLMNINLSCLHDGFKTNYMQLITNIIHEFVFVLVQLSEIIINGYFSDKYIIIATESIFLYLS